MSVRPSLGPAVRTVQLSRRSGVAMALAVAAATAVALGPGSAALAAGRDSGREAHRSSSSSAAVAGRGSDDLSRDGGKRSAGNRGGKSGTEVIPPANPKAKRAWWPFGAALHGAQIVETQAGAVATVTFQRGIVQSVSATALTVLSRDGVSQTWTLDAGTTMTNGDRRLLRKGALKVGSYVGTWGRGTAVNPTAKVVVVAWSPRQAPPATPPSASPSASPSANPSDSPSADPSDNPSADPSDSPSAGEPGDS